MLRKIILLCLLPLSAWAGKNVSCQIQNLTDCANCQERVGVSCENHQFNGFVANTVKPEKIQWVILSSTNGQERRVNTANTLSLRQLKEQKNLQPKIHLSSHEKASLESIEIPATTVLYGAVTGKAVVTLKSTSQARGLASEAPIGSIGGLKRALGYQH